MKMQALSSAQPRAQCRDFGEMAPATGAYGAAPAFLADSVEGHQVWRYMMAEGAPPRACPTGRGDGQFTPHKGASAVVGVVGTAHVRGIIQEWEKLRAAEGSKPDLEQYL